MMIASNDWKECVLYGNRLMNEFYLFDRFKVAVDVSFAHGRNREADSDFFKKVHQTYGRFNDYMIKKKKRKKYFAAKEENSNGNYHFHILMGWDGSIGKADDVLAALKEGFKGRLYKYDKKLFRSNSPFHDPNIRKVTDDKQLNYRGKVIDFRSGQITYTNSWCSKDYEKRMKRIADEFNTRHIYDDPFVPVLKHEPLKNYYEAPIVHRGRGSIKGATQFHI